MNSFLLLFFIFFKISNILCKVKVLGPSKVTSEIKKYHPKRGTLSLFIEYRNTISFW